MKKGIDYIGVGVGAVIIDKHNRIFLTLRGPKAKNDRGKWEFPGGGVEYGHTIQETIVREMQEELGITVKPLYPLHPVNHILHSEKQHWVAIAFVCKLVKGTPVIKEPNKCTAVGWFSLKETKTLHLTQPTQEELKMLKSMGAITL